MPSLFTELRRRNVFKVGAAYGIVAWLLIQVADVVLPALQAPEWTVAFVTVQLIIGFPIAVLLAWAYEMTPEGIKAAADVRPSDSITSATGHRLNYVILGFVVLAVTFLVTDQYVLDQEIRASVVGSTRPLVTIPAGVDRPGPDSPGLAPSSTLTRRTRIELVSTEPVADTGLIAHITVSSDGRHLVYAAQVSGTSMLYLRPLDQLDAQRIPGTEGAQQPFFSPDGEWVGFYTDETDAKLKKVSVRGGLPRTLADAAFSSGGFWNTDDTIVFGTQAATGGRSLFRIPAGGGTQEAVLPPSDVEGYVTPHILPDGNTVLLVIRPGAGGVGNARDGRIAALSLETGELRTLIEGGFRPQYSPTGHLLFIRAGALWAVPFDTERLQTTGREVPVLEGVQNDSFRGGAPYAFSDDGLLVYVPGGDTAIGAGSERILVWVDRGGREEPLPAEPRSYFTPRLSPDGQRLATRITQGGAWDIWIDDLVRGTSSRLTFDPSLDWTPLWTPDGERVVYTSLRQGGGLYSVAADGTGQAERLFETLANVWVDSISPDGSNLVFHFLGDLHILSMEGEHDSEPILQTPFLEQAAAISPDGRWMAYQSDESGRTEVYVRPFPNVDDGKWQVSSDGGRAPHWGPEGQELFYRDADMMMVVRVETEPTFSAGIPSVLFTGGYATPQPQVANYDMSSDGQRFLMMKNAAESEETAASTQLVVVDNWFEELNRLAPPSP